MMRRLKLTFALAFVCYQPALAQPTVPMLISDAPVTGREAFLAAVISVMMICGLINFFLHGRVAEKVYVSFAMLGVLVGGFGLLVLFGNFLYEDPVLAVILLFLLIGMFKLMGQFEVGRKPDRTRTRN